jgi:serine/threonine-protein kinase ATR
MLSGIPAEIIARRAEQCGSYARALFHWERHIRQLKEQARLKRQELDPEELYKELQFIYSRIDEPDCIEGISNYLHILDPSQQVLEHKRLGRWTAALSWYEIQVAENPCDHQLQVELLSCLKAAGRYGSFFPFFDG